MNTKNCLLILAVLLIGVTVSAQSANTDSLSLVAKIGQDQLKLGKLQNAVPQKTKDKQDAVVQAQISAKTSADAAVKLSAEPLNEDLGRTADRAASDAKRDAKRARNAGSDLDDLNKDIAKLQDKINQEKQALNKYAKVPQAVPIPTDTTSHQQAN